MKIKAKPGLVLGRACQFEGNGHMRAGNNARIGDRVSIALGAHARVEVEDALKLDSNARLVVAPECSLIAGSNLSIGSFSLIQVNANWNFSDMVTIAQHCQIFSREPSCYGALHIGRGSQIGDFSVVDLSGNIRIGANVALGAYSILHTHDHDYTQHIEVPWKGTPIVKDIVIEDGVWIGSRVTILAGVTIGAGAVVGAGSVVTQNVAPHTIVVGIPARKWKDI